MIEASNSSDRGSRGSAGASRLRLSGLAAGAVLFALVLWGGYSRHWSWTGINGRTATLWDWLHLLMLPIAFAILPIWLSRRAMLTTRHKRTGFGFLTTFGVLVLVGYLVPWAWTGFSGNTLWDWLELLALPLAVALTPLLRELRAHWGRRHSLIAFTGISIFAVVVLCGYLAKWAWTGFRGNTLWDWLQLLLLPLLIPAVVEPALTSIATAGLLESEAREREESAEADVRASAEADARESAEADVRAADGDRTSGQAQERSADPDLKEAGGDDRDREEPAGSYPSS